MRGYDPGQPVDANDAAGMLLRSLVPSGATIPSDEHARVSLYRSLTADRRLLIVIVTSRDTMSGLVARDGAQRVQLNALSATESTQLLTKRTFAGHFHGQGKRASPVPSATFWSGDTPGYLVDVRCTGRSSRLPPGACRR